MTRQAKQAVQQARPRLNLVAPLTFKICLGFAMINSGIGYVLSSSQATTLKLSPFALTSGFFGFHIWGIIYFCISFLLFWGLYRNDWNLLRRLLVFAFFTKVMWSIALLVLIAQGYPVFVTTMFWLFIAWVQGWTIVHFLPIVNWNGRGGDGDDRR